MSRDAEHRQEMRLGPLGRGEVRALLHDVVDKYDPNLSSEYIDAVLDRSEGNPLYLRLLCEQLFVGQRHLGDMGSLPRQVDELYEDAVDRITDHGRDEDALRLLHLLVEARASLSIASVAAFLEINLQRAKSAVFACMELLYEDPLTPEVDDYQLFHESLREWMRAKRSGECRRARHLLADRCLAWRDIEDAAPRSYALRFTAEHLKATEDHERLWRLLRDEHYRTAQVDVLEEYGACYTALQAGLDLYAQRNGQTPEDDARLCWLALRACELADEARLDLRRVIDKLREGSSGDPCVVRGILRRLEVLDEDAYFKLALRLLWVAAARQKTMPPESRNVEEAQLILDAIEERIPAGPEIVNWAISLSAHFMTWWATNVLSVWPSLDLAPVFHRQRGIDQELGREFEAAMRADGQNPRVSEALLRLARDHVEVPAGLRLRVLVAAGRLSEALDLLAPNWTGGQRLDLSAIKDGDARVVAKAVSEWQCAIFGDFRDPVREAFDPDLKVLQRPGGMLGQADVMSTFTSLLGMAVSGERDGLLELMLLWLAVEADDRMEEALVSTLLTNRYHDWIGEWPESSGDVAWGDVMSALGAGSANGAADLYFLELADALLSAGSHQRRRERVTQMHVRGRGEPEGGPEDWVQSVESLVARVELVGEPGGAAFCKMGSSPDELSAGWACLRRQILQTDAGSYSALAPLLDDVGARIASVLLAPVDCMRFAEGGWTIREGIYYQEAESRLSVLQAICIVFARNGDYERCARSISWWPPIDALRRRNAVAYMARIGALPDSEAACFIDTLVELCRVGIVEAEYVVSLAAEAHHLGLMGREVLSSLRRKFRVIGFGPQAAHGLAYDAGLLSADKIDCFSQDWPFPVQNGIMVGSFVADGDSREIARFLRSIFRPYSLARCRWLLVVLDTLLSRIFDRAFPAIGRGGAGAVAHSNTLRDPERRTFGDARGGASASNGNERAAKSGCLLESEVAEAFGVVQELGEPQFRAEGMAYLAIPVLFLGQEPEVPWFERLIESGAAHDDPGARGRCLGAILSVMIRLSQDSVLWRQVGAVSELLVRFTGGEGAAEQRAVLTVAGRTLKNVACSCGSSDGTDGQESGPLIFWQELAPLICRVTGEPVSEYNDKNGEGPVPRMYRVLGGFDIDAVSQRVAMAGFLEACLAIEVTERVPLLVEVAGLLAKAGDVYHAHQAVTYVFGEEHPLDALNAPVVPDSDSTCMEALLALAEWCDESTDGRGLTDEILERTSSLWALGGQADAVIAVLRRRVAAGQLVEARSLCARFKKQAERSRGLVAIVEGLLDEGSPAAAARVARDFPEASGRLRLLSSVIPALDQFDDPSALHGAWDAITGLVDESGEASPANLNVEAQLVTALSDQGRIPEATAVVGAVAEMVDNAVRNRAPDHPTASDQEQLDALQAWVARRIAEFVRIGARDGGGGVVSSALRLLPTAAELATRSSGGPAALAEVAAVWVCAGQAEEADEFFVALGEWVRSASSASERSEALGTMVKTVTAGPATEQSQARLLEVAEFYRGLPQGLRCPADHAVLGQGLARLGDMQAADTCFEDAIILVRVDSDRTRSAEWMEEVAKTASSMAGADPWPQVDGHLLELGSLLCGMPPQLDSLAALLTVAESLAAVGHPVAAVGLCDQAMEGAEALGAGEARAQLFCRAAALLVGCGDSTRSMHAFSSALAAARSLAPMVPGGGPEGWQGNPRECHRRLVGIAQKMLAADLPSQAVQIIDEVIERAKPLRKPAHAAEFLGDAASLLNQCGRWGEATDVLLRALGRAEEIANPRQRAGALRTFATHVQSGAQARVLLGYLDGRVLPGVVWKRALPKCRAAFTHHEDAASATRRSLTWYPFDEGVARGGIGALLADHVRADRDAHTNAIARLCPQLGLHGLMPAQPSRSYAFLNDWLHTVRDPDDREDITAWARRVQRGRMSEAEFDRRVSELA
jgi:hypothetical protein